MGRAAAIIAALWLAVAFFGTIVHAIGPTPVKTLLNLASTPEFATQMCLLRPVAETDTTASQSFTLTLRGLPGFASVILPTQSDYRFVMRPGAPETAVGIHAWAGTSGASAFTCTLGTETLTATWSGEDLVMPLTTTTIAFMTSRIATSMNEGEAQLELVCAFTPGSNGRFADITDSSHFQLDLVAAQGEDPALVIASQPTCLQGGVTTPSVFKEQIMFFASATTGSVAPFKTVVTVSFATNGFTSTLPLVALFDYIPLTSGSILVDHSTCHFSHAGVAVAGAPNAAFASATGLTPAGFRFHDGAPSILTCVGSSSSQLVEVATGVLTSGNVHIAECANSCSTTGDALFGTPLFSLAPDSAFPLNAPAFVRVNTPYLFEGTTERLLSVSFQLDSTFVMGGVETIVLVARDSWASGAFPSCSLLTAQQGLSVERSVGGTYDAEASSYTFEWEGELLSTIFTPAARRMPALISCSGGAATTPKTNQSIDLTAVVAATRRSVTYTGALSTNNALGADGIMAAASSTTLPANHALYAAALTNTDSDVPTLTGTMTFTLPAVYESNMDCYIAFVSSVAASSNGVAASYDSGANTVTYLTAAGSLLTRKSALVFCVGKSTSQYFTSALATITAPVAGTSVSVTCGLPSLASPSIMSRIFHTRNCKEFDTAANACSMSVLVVSRYGGFARDWNSNVPARVFDIAAGDSSAWGSFIMNADTNVMRTVFDGTTLTLPGVSAFSLTMSPAEPTLSQTYAMLFHFPYVTRTNIKGSFVQYPSVPQPIVTIGAFKIHPYAPALGGVHVRPGGSVAVSLMNIATPAFAQGSTLVPSHQTARGPLDVNVFPFVTTLAASTAVLVTLSLPPWYAMESTSANTCMLEFRTSSGLVQSYEASADMLVVTPSPSSFGNDINFSFSTTTALDCPADAGCELHIHCNSVTMSTRAYPADYTASISVSTTGVITTATAHLPPAHTRRLRVFGHMNDYGAFTGADYAAIDYNALGVVMGTTNFAAATHDWKQPLSLAGVGETEQAFAVRLSDPLTLLTVTSVSPPAGSTFGGSSLDVPVVVSSTSIPPTYVVGPTTLGYNTDFVLRNTSPVKPTLQIQLVGIVGTISNVVFAEVELQLPTNGMINCNKAALTAITDNRALFVDTRLSSVPPITDDIGLHGSSVWAACLNNKAAAKRYVCNNGVYVAQEQCSVSTNCDLSQFQVAPAFIVHNGRYATSLPVLVDGTTGTMPCVTNALSFTAPETTAATMTVACASGVMTLTTPACSPYCASYTVPSPVANYVLANTVATAFADTAPFPLKCKGSLTSRGDFPSCSAPYTAILGTWTSAADDFTCGCAATLPSGVEAVPALHASGVVAAGSNHTFKCTDPKHVMEHSEFPAVVAQVSQFMCDDTTAGFVTDTTHVTMLPSCRGHRCSAASHDALVPPTGATCSGTLVPGFSWYAGDSYTSCSCSNPLQKIKTTASTFVSTMEGHMCASEDSWVSYTVGAACKYESCPPITTFASFTHMLATPSGGGGTVSAATHVATTAANERGSSFSLSCPVGYNLPAGASMSIYCTEADGRVGALPTVDCERIRCPTPAAPTDPGVIVSNFYTSAAFTTVATESAPGFYDYDTVVKYVCGAGYIPNPTLGVQHMIETCGTAGNFKGAGSLSTLCVRACDVAAKPANTTTTDLFSPAGVSLGSGAMALIPVDYKQALSCDTGYSNTASGFPVTVNRTCTSSGDFTFDGVSINCVPNCPDPYATGSLPNPLSFDASSFSFSSTAVGSSLHVSCVDSGAPNGALYKCSAASVWEVDPSSAACPSPPNRCLIANAAGLLSAAAINAASAGPFLSTGVSSVPCVTGKKGIISNTDFGSLTCTDGTISVSESCAVLCPPYNPLTQYPLNPEHHVIISTASNEYFAVGTPATVTCPSHLQVTNAATAGTLTCTATGEWAWLGNNDEPLACGCNVANYVLTADPLAGDVNVGPMSLKFSCGVAGHAFPTFSDDPWFYCTPLGLVVGDPESTEPVEPCRAGCAAQTSYPTGATCNYGGSPVVMGHYNEGATRTCSCDDGMFIPQTGGGWGGSISTMCDGANWSVPDSQMETKACSCGPLPAVTVGMNVTIAGQPQSTAPIALNTEVDTVAFLTCPTTGHTFDSAFSSAYVCTSNGWEGNGGSDATTANCVSVACSAETDTSAYTFTYSAGPVSGAYYGAGTVATLHCSAGFQQVGAVYTATCGEQHLFHPNVDAALDSVCMPQCNLADIFTVASHEVPGVVYNAVNAIVTGTAPSIVPHGYSISADCDAGYFDNDQLATAPLYTCQTDGTWSYPQRRNCARGCVTPDLTGRAGITCSAINPATSDMVPTKTHYSPLNPGVGVSFYPAATRYSCSCDTKMWPVTAGHTSTMSSDCNETTGVWDGEAQFLSCAATCSPPTAAELDFFFGPYATTTASDTKPGLTATIECAPYTATGPSAVLGGLVCSATAGSTTSTWVMSATSTPSSTTWSSLGVSPFASMPAYCIPTCATPNASLAAAYLAQEPPAGTYTAGTQFSTMCLDAAKQAPVSASTRCSMTLTDTATREFTSAFVTNDGAASTTWGCSAVNCPAWARDFMTATSVSGTTPNDLVTAECATGYIDVEDRTSTSEKCTLAGVWTPVAGDSGLECVANTCGDFESVDSTGKILSVSYIDASLVATTSVKDARVDSYSCLGDFIPNVLLASALPTCSVFDDGVTRTLQWDVAAVNADNSKPWCAPMQAALPDGEGSVIYSADANGAVATVTCPSNMHPTNGVYQAFYAGGAWSATLSCTLSMCENMPPAIAGATLYMEPTADTAVTNAHLPFVQTSTLFYVCDAGKASPANLPYTHAACTGQDVWTVGEDTFTCEEMPCSNAVLLGMLPTNVVPSGEGFLAAGQHALGESVTVTCNSALSAPESDLVTSAVYGCVYGTGSSSWQLTSANALQCTPVCQELSVPGVSFTYSSVPRVAGSTATAECWMSQSKTTVMCDSTTMTYDEPAGGAYCTDLTCGAYSVPTGKNIVAASLTGANSSYSLSSSAFPAGAQVNLACEGLTHPVSLVDNPFAKCEVLVPHVSMQWSTTAYMCAAADCSIPAFVANAGLEYDNAAHATLDRWSEGTTVKAVCAPGYRASTASMSKSFTCTFNTDAQSSGFVAVSTTEILPVCEEIRCAAPAAIADAVYSPVAASYAVGDVVSWTCAGSSVNPDVATTTQVCQAVDGDGVWSAVAESTFACSFSGCVLPATMALVSAGPLGIAVGTTSLVQCASPYVNNDSAVTAVSYACAAGKILAPAVGSPALQCVPTCAALPTEGILVSYEAGAAVPKQGVRATLSCKSSLQRLARFYTADVDGFHTTCQSSGLWNVAVSALSSACVDTCSLPVVQNGAAALTSGLTGMPVVDDIVALTCDTNYASVPSAASTATCMAGGSWSHQLRCIYNGCATPAGLNSNVVWTPVSASTVAPFALDHAVRLSCAAGYEASPATADVACGYNATTTSYQWGAGLTTFACVESAPNKCAAYSAQLPANAASLTYSSAAINGTQFYAAGTTVSVVCATNFTLVAGATPAVCQASGAWTEPSAVCEPVPVTCPALPDIVTNGAVALPSVRTVDAVATYTCLAGFEFAGESYTLTSAKRTCASTGEWAGEIPACVAVPTCTAATTFGSATVVYSPTVATGASAAIGTSAEVVCASGGSAFASAVDSMSVQCSRSASFVAATGAWSAAWDGSLGCIPAPSVQHVRLASAGNVITVTFAMATAMPNVACEALLTTETFALIGGAGAKCTWTAADTLTVQVAATGFSATIATGSAMFGFRSGVIAGQVAALSAAFPVIAATSKPWTAPKMTDAPAKAIEAPTTPSTVSVVLSAPAEVSLCASGITLDASKSTTTAVSGALTYTFSLTTTNTAVKGAFDAAVAAANPGGVRASVRVPMQDAFVAGTYTVRVEVRNWMGITAAATASVTILAAAVPQLVIEQGAAVTVSPAAPLRLVAQVQAAVCAGASADANAVTGVWTRVSGPAVPTTAGVVWTQAVLAVPALTLTAGSEYVFRYTATQGTQSVAATTTVVVGRLPLVARVSTSAVTTATSAVASSTSDAAATTAAEIAALKPLFMVVPSVAAGVTLYAAGSSDPESKQQAALSYEWSCLQVRTTTGSQPQAPVSCTAALSVATSGASVTLTPTAFTSILPNEDGSEAVTLAVTVAVRKTGDSARVSRVVMAGALVRTLGYAATPMYVGNGDSTRLGTAAALRLSSTVMARDAHYALLWTCESGNLDLFASGVLGSVMTGASLVVNAAALKAGQTYTFRLSVFSTTAGGATFPNTLPPAEVLSSAYLSARAPGPVTGEFASATVTVSTNGAPFGGSCSSYASDAGAGLTTVACQGWTDADLPLRYKFHVQRAAGKRQLVASTDTRPSADLLLSVGSSTVIVEVADRLGAATLVTVPVTVASSSQDTGASTMASKAESAAAAGDATMVVQAVVAATAAMAQQSGGSTAAAASSMIHLLTSAATAKALAGLENDARAGSGESAGGNTQSTGSTLGVTLLAGLVDQSGSSLSHDDITAAADFSVGQIRAFADAKVPVDATVLTAAVSLIASSIASSNSSTSTAAIVSPAVAASGAQAALTTTALLEALPDEDPQVFSAAGLTYMLWRVSSSSEVDRQVAIPGADAADTAEPLFKSLSMADVAGAVAGDDMRFFDVNVRHRHVVATKAAQAGFRSLSSSDASSKRVSFQVPASLLSSLSAADPSVDLSMSVIADADALSGDALAVDDARVDEDTLEEQKGYFAGCTGLTIYSSSAGEELPVSIDVPVTPANATAPAAAEATDADLIFITIPHAAAPNVNFTATCQFYDEATKTWGNAGCAVAETAATYTICKCNHLTMFSVRMSPKYFLPKFTKLDLDSFTSISWRDITEHPAPIITLLAWACFAVLLIVLVRPIDARYDVQGLRKLISEWDPNAQILLTKAEEYNISDDAPTWKFLVRRFFISVRRDHPWLSLALRPTTDNYTSQARALTTCVSILAALTVAALFFGSQEPEAAYMISAISALIMIPVEKGFELIYDNADKNRLKRWVYHHAEQVAFLQLTGMSKFFPQKDWARIIGAKTQRMEDMRGLFADVCEWRETPAEIEARVARLRVRGIEISDEMRAPQLRVPDPYKHHRTLVAKRDNRLIHLLLRSTTALDGDLLVESFHRRSLFLRLPRGLRLAGVLASIILTAGCMMLVLVFGLEMQRHHGTGVTQSWILSTLASVAVDAFVSGPIVLLLRTVIVFGIKYMIKGACCSLRHKRYEAMPRLERSRRLSIIGTSSNLQEAAAKAGVDPTFTAAEPRLPLDSVKDVDAFFETHPVPAAKCSPAEVDELNAAVERHLVARGVAFSSLTAGSKLTIVTGGATLHYDDDDDANANDDGFRIENSDEDDDDARVAAIIPGFGARHAPAQQLPTDEAQGVTVRFDRD